MPDCPLATASPFYFYPRLKDDVPYRSLPQALTPDLPYQVMCRRSEPANKCAIGIDDKPLQDLLNGLLEALNALKQHVGHAMAAVLKVLDSVRSVHDSARPDRSMNSSGKAPATPPAPSLDSTPLPKKPALANSFRNISKTKAKAKSTRAKRLNAESIVARGLSEFPLLSAFIAQNKRDAILPKPVARHLLCFYSFLGVTDAQTRQQVDALFLDFLQFGMALSADVDQAGRSNYIAYFFGAGRALVDRAIQFAEIWADARQVFAGGDFPELRYAHIAAIDFLAAEILRSVGADASAVERSLEALSDAFHPSRNPVYFRHLSLELPASLEEDVASEILDLDPAHRQEDTEPAQEPLQLVSSGKNDDIPLPGFGIGHLV